MVFAINEELYGNLLAENSGRARALEALDKNRLNSRDFADIISFRENDAEFLEKLAGKAQSLTRMRFGCVKGFYIPLYLSSVCHNVCSYCGFRGNNGIKRKTLREGEIRKELEDIYEKGFKNVLLVSGEQSDFKNIEYLCAGVSIAKKLGFHSIAVELGALDERSASMLARAGAQSFVLYQETYHPETYEKVHLKGKKADYGWRIGGANRAIRSGFRQVTLGFLAGLSDNPLFDALALYEHISQLKHEFWEIEFSISLPRIRRAVVANGEFRNVEDREYARILMAFRLAFPDAPINLSTREPAQFRDGMSDICVTHLSVESKTAPGGYASNSTGGLEQFPVFDGRSIDEISGALDGMGYDVHFKDWEIELNRIGE